MMLATFALVFIIVWPTPGPSSARGCAHHHGTQVAAFGLSILRILAHPAALAGAADRVHRLIAVGCDQPAAAVALSAEIVPASRRD
jgi:hypothetical protein